ncbi:peptide deformylase [Dehalococcoidia bacterium]|nr:peptide deformylase [Dehalococcoidia bacterium]
MAILKIRTAPDPILRRKTSRVNKIDDSIRRLADDMIETMYDAHGIGLAANQIGVPLRMLVMGIPTRPDEEVPDSEECIREYVIVNPEFVKKVGERQVEEGCLSIPGYRGSLTRAESVKVKGLALDGSQIRIKAEGLMAQALEHEIDHLEGILYLDHMKEQGTLDTLVELDSSESVEVAAG